MKSKTSMGSLAAICGIAFISSLVISSPVSAELKSLNEKQMRNETAQSGLVTFSENGNRIRMYTDIHLETWADIDSMKIGYYERSVPASGGGTVNQIGWDQDWSKATRPDGSTTNGVMLGTQTKPLQMDGFVFKADFNGDLGGAEKPSLKRLVIGTNRLTGDISANMKSFTGIYNSSIVADGASDPNANKPLIRQNLGEKTFNFGANYTTTEDQSKNEGFFLVITPEATGGNTGIQIVAGYNEMNISTKPGGSEWWNTP